MIIDVLVFVECECLVDVYREKIDKKIRYNNVSDFLSIPILLGNVYFLQVNYFIISIGNSFHYRFTHSRVRMYCF